LKYVSLASPPTGCDIKSSPPGVFGSFLSNGLKYKCEILHTYVDHVYMYIYWY